MWAVYCVDIYIYILHDLYVPMDRILNNCTVYVSCTYTRPLLYLISKAIYRYIYIPIRRFLYTMYPQIQRMYGTYTQQIQHKVYTKQR